VKFQGRWPPSIAIVAVEAFEFNDSGARFRRIGRLSFLYAAMRNITADWTRSVMEWRQAMNQFAIAYGERFTHPT
jgi:hypothetical protein